MKPKIAIARTPNIQPKLSVTQPSEASPTNVMPPG